ncbi:MULTISPECIES: hypothetical protein [unclassified Bradyrhizobium]|uniref:hypothetical protein n=1 Tax=unclassified Bradyrhizobium TaxID=2631580 RepID=UPI003394744C
MKVGQTYPVALRRFLRNLIRKDGQVGGETVNKLAFSRLTGQVADEGALRRICPQLLKLFLIVLHPCPSVCQLFSYAWMSERVSQQPHGSSLRQKLEPR